jgi:nucleotidyltransferase AbiEii toxin of type IV toxin-antitoxin system
VKDHSAHLLSSLEGDLLKRCVVREYLQARILQALQESGAFLNWLFLGGTALRFLYSIPRYSEDLDFALADASTDSLLRPRLKRVARSLETEDYEVNVTINEKNVGHAAFVRFPGLLFELGLSPHPSENLSVRVKVDTNPPKGATWETTLVRRHVVLNLPHHDKASLLSGKIHAIFSRIYVKGRDLFDLVWYLSDPTWPDPNLVLLNSSLSQTQWKGPTLSERNWRETLLSHLEGINWNRALDDTAPFLEREHDLALLTLENCRSLLHPS